MRRAGFGTLRRALIMAAHSGFPWAMGGGEGHSPVLRRAIRRSVASQWPAPVRPLGLTLMALLWPLESLRDAVVFAFQADRAVLGRRSRAWVALRAWAAALGHNLPPVDYLSYRLFEPGRPGPGCWLHSADSQLHFSRIAAPAVRALAWDKLAFTELGDSAGAGMMPVLAVYGAGGPVRPFAGGAPPPIDLLVKPRRGFGGAAHSIWHWRGGRHVAAGAEAGVDLETWLAREGRSGDLLVQPLAQPPERFGPVVPSSPPVVSIITAEWPGGQRRAILAMVVVSLAGTDAEVHHARQVDVETGRLLAASPGDVAPAFGQPPDRRDLGATAIPGWPEILSQVDRVHAALPGPAPVLKWDVILTDQGPRLLEANTGTGIYVLQSMMLRPITETPLGAALEAWAR
jgi:hypothetical protein